MIDPRARAGELRDQAGDLPYGPTKVALLEEAVRLADTLGDVRLAYEARQDLIQAASFSDRSDILLVAFSWCLAQYDRDPSRFDSRRLLWEYKWVVNAALQFPEISRARLDSLVEDMGRRYREAGQSPHAVWKLRRIIAEFYGERDAARRAHARYRRARPDDLSDCPACAARTDQVYFQFLRQWARSVDAAGPVLRGTLRCTHEPHRILAGVLIPLLHLGRVDEARDYQARGYRLVGGVAHFVMQHAEHLRFMTLTGQWARARGMAERHLPTALKAVESGERFEFLLAAWLWAERQVDRGTARLKLRLPEGPPAPDAGGMVDLAALRDWFAREAAAIAARFDARAGTAAFQDEIDDWQRWRRLVVE